jgi:hypothetical protein
MMWKTMQTRTVVLIGSLSLAAGWLFGTTTVSQSPSAPVGGAAGVRRDPRPLGSPPQEPAAPYTEQLRLRMQEVPRSPSPGRNPFSFGSRRKPVAPAPNRAIESPSMTEAPPPVLPQRPRFTLSGIASSERDGKTTLTAILTDNGTLLFATVGEKLAGGYSVTGITETTMVIADPSGAEQTITLGPARRP